jgi:hypothetical protein
MKARNWLATILIASAVPALGAVLIAIARLYAWSLDQDWTKVLAREIFREYWPAAATSRLAPRRSSYDGIVSSPRLAGMPS